MKIMKIITFLALLCFSSSVFSNNLWITIGSDGLETLKNSAMMATYKSLEAQSERNGVAILKVNEDDLSIISTLMHENHNRCGGFIAHESLEQAQAAQLSPLIRTISPVAIYSINNANVANSLKDNIEEFNIRESIDALSKFTNRYYSTSGGLNGAKWIKSKWESLTSARTDIFASFYNHSWKQPSVILTIQGKIQPDEIVVMGAHLDSIVRFGTGEETLAPGADDDASGIAVLTEVINAIVKTGYKPDKTLVFMGYAAEEVGLRGSSAIASDYRSQNKNVVGAFQLDMTNYQGSSNDIYIVDDYTNSAQNTFLKQLAQTYLNDLNIGTTRCGYACSDHASWHNRGYTVSFPFESAFNNSNPYIHTKNDTISISNGNALHAVKFGKLAAVYVAELAKGDISADPQINLN